MRASVRWRRTDVNMKILLWRARVRVCRCPRSLIGIHDAVQTHTHTHPHAEACTPHAAIGQRPRKTNYCRVPVTRQTRCYIATHTHYIQTEIGVGRDFGGSLALPPSRISRCMILCSVLITILLLFYCPMNSVYNNINFNFEPKIIYRHYIGVYHVI